MSGAIQPIPQSDSFKAEDFSLLIVDDDRGAREGCREVCESLGFVVFTAENAVTAMRLLATRSFDVVLMDVRLPGPDGLDLLSKIKGLHPETEVIMVSGHATVDSVLSAMKSGAYDFLRKPFHLEELKVLLERVVIALRNTQEDRAVRERLKNDPGYGGLVGQSAEMRKLYRMISKVASSKHPVLIVGESGTGKEKVARAIHANGNFRDRPFVAMDCASPSPVMVESELFGHARGAFTGAVRAREGLMSVAQGGTVFLNEIGEMPLELQGKLLRALQEKEIRPMGASKPLPMDVRVIAATERDLEAAVQQGTFRRDLFFRINVVSLRLPPLRDRKEDLHLLADHVLEQIAQSRGVRHSLSPEAMKLLLAYDWPGNVRELENSLERAAAASSGSVLSAADLPPQIQTAVRASNGNGHLARGKIVPLAEVEKQAILSTLERLNGDKLMTARLLGIGKTTLYRKLKEYGIGDRWIIRQIAK